MGIFDEVVSNAKNVAASVGKKAGQIVDISKLKFSAAETESEISKKYQTLGKMVYNATKDKSLAPEIDPIVDELDKLQAELADIEAQINAIRNKKVCPQCKKLNDIDAVFCNACGAVLPVTVKEEEPVEEVKEECCEAAEEAKCCAEEAAEEAKCCAEEAAEEVKCCAEKAAEEVKKAAEDVIEEVKEITEE